MTASRRRILAELPLPLEAGDGQVEAIAIAIAIEDALHVTLPDEMIDVAHLGRRESIEGLLDGLPGGT